jgi:hypothetical protein
MQWKLTHRAPLDEETHIQIGTLAGGYYVDHTGFGVSRFPDKRAAWDAIKDLMRWHSGEWVEVPCDREPFAALHRPDGSRVLYDMADNCLYGHWGDRKDTLWARYEQAMAAGTTFRRTETHALFEGLIEAITFIDPNSGDPRHAVLTAVDPGSDYYVVDYPDRETANAAYEKVVYANRNDEFPYRSSDMRDVVVDRASALPDNLVIDDNACGLHDYAVMHTLDYEELYGAPKRKSPHTVAWPHTPALTKQATVRRMTAEPRDWPPGDARLKDITPLLWEQDEPDLQPRDLAFLTLADGRQLLASAHNGAAHVWSPADGSSLIQVTGHSEAVVSVGLTTLADGSTLLATGGKDGLVRVWTVREGHSVSEIEAHRMPVNSLAWVRPPGQIPLLVTGSDEATVTVWDPDRRRSVVELKLGEARADCVWSVAATVLADGHACVAAGTLDVEDTATVHVWDMTAGEILHTLPACEPGSWPLLPSVAVATLADRSFRIASAAGPVIRVWDGVSGNVVRAFSLPDARHSTVALAVLPDLRVAVAATDGVRTTVWDSESGAELATVTGDKAGFKRPVDLAPGADGGLLLVVSGRGYGPARLLRLDF